MKAVFKRAILYARQYRSNGHVIDSLEKLAKFLPKQEIEVYQDSDTSECTNLKLPILAREEMGKAQDIIIVVGGDGSLLSAARMAIKVNVPVIGINRGCLGFLTDISPDEIDEQLKDVLTGKFLEERRFLLQARIYDEENTYFLGDALNDVVLGRGSETHLIEFSIEIDKQKVCRYRSDGLIVSTPTGSTAYSLSAGGPIMHPLLNAIVVVPMFSHSLSSRPLVIDSHSQIDLHISEKNEADLRISCDGHQSRMVKPNQYVSITRNAQQLRLLHPIDYLYYDTLRKKLGWESKYQE